MVEGDGVDIEVVKVEKVDVYRVWEGFEAVCEAER